MNRSQPHDAAPAVGRVGRYELLRPLGAGGMGEVFLARVVGAAGFEARVVIKRILPHLARDEAFVRRFVDEGKLTATLRHAGIAQVLDLGVEDGVVFLAMEYVDGRDLRALARLAALYGPAPSVELRVHVLARVLEALDYAHRATDDAGRPAGVIHRDVSPSNVMLSRAGEVKLLDFGIARAISPSGGVTTTGTIQGKYGYMSPEQAAGARLDPRSDQFSVGVMAWELFAGRRPFDGPNDLKTLDNVRTVDPGPLSAVAPDAPPEVAEAVARLLAKHPADRFPTADEARRALQAYLNRVGASPGARDVAEWVEAVGQAAPPGAADQRLTLDEALRLSLDGSPRLPRGGAAAPASSGLSTGPHAGPHAGPRTATVGVGAAPALAASLPPAPPGPPAGGPEVSAALTATRPAATSASPASPEASETPSRPTSPGPPALAPGAHGGGPPDPARAAGAPDASPAPASGAPVTVTVVKKAGWPLTALLVGFNVLLLAAVAVLLLESREAPSEGPPGGPGVARAAGPAAASGDETPAADASRARSAPAVPQDAPAAGAVAAVAQAAPDIRPGTASDASSSAATGPDAAHDAGADAASDAGPDVASDAGPDGASDAGPDGGGDTGAPVPGLIPITLRPHPADAVVSVPGEGAKGGVRVVRVAPGESVRVTVRREGYRAKVVRVRGDGPRRLSVRLAKEATGEVAFRFFPASASVRLDGRAVKTGGSNLLRRTLPVGEHKLVLEAWGRRKVVRFEVRQGVRTNLRTLRLEARPAPAEGPPP